MVIHPLPCRAHKGNSNGRIVHHCLVQHVIQLVVGKAHTYTTSVKLIHIQIDSVRLTHGSAMDVKLVHIYTSITTVRLTHSYCECEAHSHLTL